MTETLGVLRDRFGWDGYSLHDMRAKLLALAELVEPSEIVNAIPFDPPDNRILECAIEAKSDFIVSEDKDLLRLKAYRGIPILTVVEFLNVEASPTEIAPH